MDFFVDCYRSSIPYRSCKVTNIQEVYHNTDSKDIIVRKHEIVESLERNLQFSREAAYKLEEKAWEILRVTSASFGIISALEITLTKGNLGPGFWLALAFVLVLYLLQVREVLQAVTPMSWRLVPGTSDGNPRFDSLVQKYVQEISSGMYLDKLIVDYVGKLDEHSQIQLGAIQHTENNNLKKAKHVRMAAKLLSAIIVGLVVMAVIAVI